MESEEKKLKVVTVAPITKAIVGEDLTYFTTKDISTGSLVLISLRNKDIVGLILSVNPAEDLKSEIKTSEFNLKKIKKILPNMYSPHFVAAAKKTAEHFVSPLGQVINSLTPKVVLSSLQKKVWQDSGDSFALIENSKNTTTSGFEISVLGLPDEERHSFYKSLIREEFAKKRSVFLVLPTVHDVEICGEILKKGIEEYTTILHGQMSAKNMLIKWQRALEETHPILVIATSTFLSLPRRDVTTIIIDKEGSSFYKTLTRPFIDIRMFVENLAREKFTRLILGDVVPKIEDIHYARSGNSVQELPLRYRFPKDIEQEVLDMRKANGKDSVFSVRIKQALKSSIDKKERTIILCARKGLGTGTICSDCGGIVSCNNCGIPLTLYKTKNGNLFICNRCKASSSADVRCGKCGGWKLKVLGIATEKVEEEIKSFFPKAEVFRLDGNIAKSRKQAGALVALFLKMPGAILVATEMVLNYLNQDIENVFVASIDTLFSIPDFRMNENIFGLLTRLRLRASRKFFIQTRRPEERVLKYILSGDLLEFYRGEIEEREKFNYPPFSTLVKITTERPGETATKEMDELQKFLQNYRPIRFDKGILLKADSQKWPHDYSNLLKTLNSLPKRFVIKIDPESIF